MLLCPCFKVGKSIRRTMDPRSDATGIRWKIHFNSATHTLEAINLTNGHPLEDTLQLCHPYAGSNQPAGAGVSSQKTITSYEFSLVARREHMFEKLANRQFLHGAD